MKPSEQITRIVPAIANLRAAEEKAKTQSMVIDLEADGRLMNRMLKDPLTWIYAILTYLDDRADASGAAKVNPGKSLTENIQANCPYCLRAEPSATGTPCFNCGRKIKDDPQPRTN